MLKMLTEVKRIQWRL